jgi:hypothetical protein
LRQGLLSEPQASSGPAAMLLAVSRSPSSIPRWSPCPERCHLPLASLNHIHLSKTQKHPRLHPLPERCLLPLASLNHIHLSKTQKHPRLHPPPEQCHLPLASLSILLTKPQKHPRLHPPSDATFLWRPSTTSIHTKKSPASSYSKDTGLPSVIYKLEMRLELTTPSLRVKCSTD